MMRFMLGVGCIACLTGAVVADVAAQGGGRRIAGVARDTLTGEPIPFAVVSLESTGTTTLADRRGRFVIDAPNTAVVLQARVIGYRPASVGVSALGDRSEVDVFLRRIPVQLADIMVTGEWVNPAHRIIRAAIARKNELLDRIQDYRFDAYTKLLIRDAAKHRDSTDSVILITETQTTAYWERPDRYQETIVRRSQSSNVSAENNLVSVGEIVNFNKERVDLQKYSVPSPTANDALDHYDYFILDTIMTAGRPAFRLAIEARSQSRPLFAGMIDIADSTFDVLAIDVRANEAIRYDFIENIRYQQTMEEVEPTYWMPAAITFTGELHLGVPLPGLPREMAFTHAATLRDFRFDQGDGPATLGEYLVVVDRGADDADSTEWESMRPAALPDVERAAYQRIDSLEHRPPSAGDLVAVGVFGAFLLTSRADLFHFNRVEGPYLGVGATLRDLSPDWVARFKTGHAFDLNAWQHEYGFNYRVSERQRWWVGGNYRDEVRPRPSVITAGRNTSQIAMFAKIDPNDYYLERGFALSSSVRLTNFTTLALQYNDHRQQSLPAIADFSLFDRDRILRGNPAITDGRLRSVGGSIVYDSRPRLKRKGRDFLFDFVVQTQARLGWEFASPSLVSNDFDFFRAFVSVHRVQRTLNFGLTTIDAFAGTSFGDLPPQRFFTVDFGNGVVFERAGFNTFADRNYSGNRAAMFFVSHDFDQQLFRRTGLPLLRDVPFTVSGHGGAFWTDLADYTPLPGAAPVSTAPGGYVELGFGLGNLTPMIAPFNFAAWFTWQVTDHNTSRFKFRLGIPAPN